LEEYERDFEGLKGLRWIWWIFVKIGGDEDLMRKWEELFESIDQVRIKINSNPIENRFMDLALNGEDEELTPILSKYPFLIDLIYKHYKTPLHLAIKGNHLSTCELLLDLGADVFMELNYWVLL